MKLTAIPAVFLTSAGFRQRTGQPSRGQAAPPALLRPFLNGSGLQSVVSCLSALLVLGNLIGIPVAAQAPPVVNVTVVEGEGAVNNVKSKNVKVPVIQVTDENHRPIAGAAVVFFLPDQGASGVFVNGSRTLTVTTNAEGRASATGLKPNNVNGPLQIRVTASFQGQTASAVVNEVNEGGNGSTSGGGGGGMGSGTKLAIILLIVGGAAAGGILAATHGGGGSSSASTPPAIVISAGTPSVGAPKQ